MSLFPIFLYSSFSSHIIKAMGKECYNSNESREMHKTQTTQQTQQFVWVKYACVGSFYAPNWEYVASDSHFSYPDIRRFSWNVWFGLVVCLFYHIQSVPIRSAKAKIVKGANMNMSLWLLLFHVSWRCNANLAERMKIKRMAKNNTVSVACSEEKW